MRALVEIAARANWPAYDDSPASLQAAMRTSIQPAVAAITAHLRDVVLGAREDVAAAKGKHGYWRNPEVGGECPECGHLYYAKPPGAHMDPDLDWLRNAIDQHVADAALAVVVGVLGGAE